MGNHLDSFVEQMQIDIDVTDAASNLHTALRFDLFVNFMLTTATTRRKNNHTINADECKPLVIIGYRKRQRENIVIAYQNEVKCKVNAVSKPS